MCKWTENNYGVQAFHSICMHISNTNVCDLELYKANLFFHKKLDCCPTEGKQKRKYKIFKSKNVTNSVAGELSCLLIYAQKAKLNQTNFLFYLFRLWREHRPPKGSSWRDPSSTKWSKSRKGPSEKDSFNAKVELFRNQQS